MADTVNEYLAAQRHRHEWRAMAGTEGDVPVDECGCGLLRLAIEEETDA